MSHFERGSERHPIPPGESALAMDAGGPSVVPGPGGPGRRAILKAAPDGEVVIVKVQGADLTINGVRLGSEPTPLLHGDKVGAGGIELTFVDERRSGSTVFMAALEVPAPRGAGHAGPSEGAAATGGRLVCLTDGREYTIGGASVVFGREAGCDIVVSAKDVSRRHAEILPTAKGYVLIDHSTNGTFVNDERIPGQRVLARGDVIRVGTDEFRFYAEQGAPRESEPRHAALQATMHEIRVADLHRPPVPSVVPPEPPRPSAPVPSVGGAEAPGRASAGQAAPPDEAVARQSAASRGPLAAFLLREGAQKGTRLPVRSLVANVGRAEYNDVMLNDGSVSAQHAKLLRREGIWILMDLESTNGTYVDGERVVGEAPLAPGSMVRFGDVRATFEPLDDALGFGTGAPKTSLLARSEIPDVSAAGASTADETPVLRPVAPPKPPPSPSAEPKRSAPAAARASAEKKRAPIVVPGGGGVKRSGSASWGSPGTYRTSARHVERVRVVVIGALIVVAVTVTALILLLT